MIKKRRLAQAEKKLERAIENKREYMQRFNGRAPTEEERETIADLTKQHQLAYAKYDFLRRKNG